MINYEQRRIIMMEEGYDIAQICENGHVVNSNARIYPHFNQKLCGTKTTTCCSGCGAPIRGAYLDGLYAGYTAPGFCSYCGDPFPWTQTRLRAVRELVKELDMLDGRDKVLLAKCIDDLITNSPLVSVAATRFKRLMRQVGPETGLMFQQILMDITPDSVRLTLWP